MAPASNRLATPDFWDDACKHLSKRDRVMPRTGDKVDRAALNSLGGGVDSRDEHRRAGDGRCLRIHLQLDVELTTLGNLRQALPNGT